MLRILPFSAILALSACVTVTEVPARTASVKLVPESATAVTYCKRRTSGARNVLDVSFENAGTADYPGGDPVSVSFGKAVSNGVIPPIMRGKTATIAVPLPASCFDPDCDFVIAMSNQPEVQGLCLG